MIRRPLLFLVASFALLPAVAGLGLHALPASPVAHGTPVMHRAAIEAYPMLPYPGVGHDDAFGHVAAFPGTRVTWDVADGQGGAYGIDFKCPEPSAQLRAALGCPLYIQDLEDILGSPLLVVDRSHPDLIAFHALHGGTGLHPLPADAPPSPHSRDDLVHQPHTVFTNTAGGAGDWFDGKYYSPFWGEYDSIFGEDLGILLDSQRRMHITSLYATRNDADPDYTYRLIFRPLSTINEPPDYTGSYSTRTFDMGDKIDGLSQLHVPATDHIVVLWRNERGALGEAAGGLQSFIDGQYLPASGGWKRFEEASRIGPCRASSNPVAIGAEIYVACLPGEGYPHGSLEFWHIHALDTRTMAARHAGVTPIRFGQQGNLMLAPREKQDMVLAAAGVGGDGKQYVKVAFGSGGGNWSDPVDHFDAVTNLTEDARAQTGFSIKALRINALAWHPETHYTHFIYVENYDQTGPAAPARSGVPEYFKRMAVLTPTGAMQGKADLGVGQGAARVVYGPEYEGVGNGAFSDIHDDIEIFRDPTGKWREFVAYGDYGYVRLAEVVEENAVPLGGPPIVSQPPIPAPNPGLNPNVVGAVAGALAGAASLRMLAAKKKVTAEAPA